MRLLNSRPKQLICASLLLVGGFSFQSRPKVGEKVLTGLLAGAQASRQTMDIINRSCRDCHSEQTTYPWYSYVAPISWLIQRDVKRGREHLNFSQWPEYSLLRRERCLSEIANQVADGDMPLPLYVFVHRSARLSPQDAKALFDWTQTERSRLILEGKAALP
jgi:Haem-binding domain